MANIRVGAAIGAGFSTIARRPLSVLAWGFLPAALQGTAIALIGPAYVNMIGHLVAAGAAPGSSEMLALQSQIAPVAAMVQVINIVQLFVSAMVYCAVFRAVIHPERSGFAYLRVSMPELFMALLIVAAFIVFFIGMLIVMIPAVILVAIVAAATHGSGAAMALMLPLLILAAMLAMVYFGLRFSFVGPMMVDDGRFHLFESWTMTKGRFGSLFLIALGLVGVFILFEIVLVAIMLGVGAAAVQSVGGVEQFGAMLKQSPQALFAHLWPFLAVYGVLLIPIAGCGVTIAGAPFASAYRDVAHDPADASAAFA